MACGVAPGQRPRQGANLAVFVIPDLIRDPFLSAAARSPFQNEWECPPIPHVFNGLEWIPDQVRDDEALPGASPHVTPSRTASSHGTAVSPDGCGMPFQ